MNTEMRQLIKRERDAAVRRSLEAEKLERRRRNSRRARVIPETDGRKTRVLQPS